MPATTSTRTARVCCVRPGRKVVVLDSLELGHRAALGDFPLVKGDIDDPKAVAEAVEQCGIDSVIHFAAYNLARS